MSIALNELIELDVVYMDSVSHMKNDKSSGQNDDEMDARYDELFKEYVEPVLRVFDERDELHKVMFNYFHIAQDGILEMHYKKPNIAFNQNDEVNNMVNRIDKKVK